jgi:hypothetical protein
MWKYQNEIQGNDSVTNITINYNEQNGQLIYIKEIICSWTGDDMETKTFRVTHGQELVKEVEELDSRALTSLYQKFPELKEDEDGEMVTISKKRYEELLEIEWMYMDMGY